MAPMALVLFVNWESPASKPRSPTEERTQNGGKHWAVTEVFWQDLLIFVNISTKIQPNIFHLVRNSLKYLWKLFLVSPHFSKSL